jgi:hypothetical protein
MLNLHSLVVVDVGLLLWVSMLIITTAASPTSHPALPDFFDGLDTNVASKCDPCLEKVLGCTPVRPPTHQAARSMNKDVGKLTSRTKL